MPQAATRISHKAFWPKQKLLAVFANFLYRTDGKHKMVCTSFQNYHNFPNKKVILYIQPDMLFPGIKPNKIFLMLISIVFLIHLQGTEFQGNEIMLEGQLWEKQKREEKKRTKKEKNRHTSWAHHPHSGSSARHLVQDAAFEDAHLLFSEMEDKMRGYGLFSYWEVYTVLDQNVFWKLK